MGTSTGPETEDRDDRLSSDTDPVSTTSEAPPVVAVVVATDPSDRFEVCLQSLLDQDYGELSLLVIDAGSAEPVADRVAAVAPDAFVHRLANNPGRSAAADQALELVSGAKFLLFCHDDVALESHALSAMVEETFRSNAGIVGPKLVDWDDTRRLRHVGMGSDRFGVLVDLIEPGDFDQEQYDAVRDVFVIPSAVQLVRADLFRALNGFDPKQPHFGNDLDLCWRAHVAGARVMVVPSAVARHGAEELGSVSADSRRKALARSRLRSVAVSSTRGSLVQLVPLSILLALLEAVFSLLTGQRRQAGDAVGALFWNASNLGDIRERRAKLAAIRQVPDREVRALQVGGSARVSRFLRNQRGTSQGKVLGYFGSVRNTLDEDDAGIVRDGLLLVGFTAILILFGSRHLLTRTIEPVGLVPDVGSIGGLLREWWGGWRSVGLGGSGEAPTALVVLALLKTALFGSDRLLMIMLVVGPLLVGAFGMWRLVRPFGSHRAAGASMLVFVCVPIVPSAMATARWDALVLWAVAPFLLGSIFRVQGAEPFGSRHDRAGTHVVPRPAATRLIRWGLLVALVATFVPAVVPIAVGLALVFAGGSVLLARPAGATRLVLAAGVAIIGPAALHIPWSYDVISKGSWDWLVGRASPYASFDSMADLVRFAPGPNGPSMLALGLLVAAGVALVVGRGHRFDAGAMGWLVATAAFFVAWIDRRGWFEAAMPAPELLLSIAAAGLSLSVGIAVRSVESDLAAFRFGWRQATAIAGGVGIAAAAIVGTSAALDGRWQLPTNGYAVAVSPLTDDIDGSVRVLLVGDRGVLPIDSLTSDAGVTYMVTDNFSLDVTRRWAPGSYGETAHVGELLDLAASGDTARLGRLLSAYGIDLVVVVPQLAPPPFTAAPISGGAAIEDALSSQLDLQRVTGTPPLFVYRNISSDGPSVSLDVDRVPTSGSVLDLVSVDLAAAPRVPLRSELGGRWSGSVPEGNIVVVASDAAGWTVEGARDSLRPGLGGNIVIDGGPEGEVVLSYTTDWTRRALLGAQFGLVFVGWQLAQRRRRSQRMRSGDVA